jgi:hypothetical protein
MSTTRGQACDLRICDYRTHPNEDGTRAVCLWESGSVATVEAIVEGAAGNISTNEYFGVNEQNASGLPAVSAVAS